jgi:hypothetical protein
LLAERSAYTSSGLNKITSVAATKAPDGDRKVSLARDARHRHANGKVAKARHSRSSGC